MEKETRSHHSVSIFDAETPIGLFRSWMSEAMESEINDPNAISLATVDQGGMPNVRVVLLKEIEDNAFVFYTNYESAKGREIAATGRAAFVVHWKSLRRQIRVRGVVSREDGPQADAYYASRGIESRLGAWASEQSRPLEDRQTLLTRLDEVREKYGATPPRPPHWGGFRLYPEEIEFWQDGAARLHDRELWSRGQKDKKWSVRRLSP